MPRPKHVAPGSVMARFKFEVAEAMMEALRELRGALQTGRPKEKRFKKLYGTVEDPPAKNVRDTIAYAKIREAARRDILELALGTKKKASSYDEEAQFLEEGRRYSKMNRRAREEQAQDLLTETGLPTIELAREYVQLLIEFYEDGVVRWDELKRFQEMQTTETPQQDGMMNGAVSTGTPAQ